MVIVRGRNPKGYGPGSFGCHEALHMASFFLDAFERGLYEHPAIEANQKWKAAAGQVMADLHTLYQAIGREHLQVKPNS